MIIKNKRGQSIEVTDEDFAEAKRNRIPRSAVISRVKAGRNVEFATTTLGRIKPQLSEEELTEAEAKGVPRNVAINRFSNHGWTAGAALNTPYTAPTDNKGGTQS